MDACVCAYLWYSIGVSGQSVHTDRKVTNMAENTRGGYSVGSRTERPHSSTGWTVPRSAETPSTEAPTFKANQGGYALGRGADRRKR